MSLESEIDETIISEIKTFVQRHQPPIFARDAMLSIEDFRQLGLTPRMLFPIASKDDVAKAEADLGFPIPTLLKRVYLEISNGIAGFAYDIIGLGDGCSSDTGTLIQAYNAIIVADEPDDRTWTTKILPFCDWGCAIYSCVDCSDSTYPVFTYQYPDLHAEKYSLRSFFEMWLRGKVEFSTENVPFVSKEIQNPFTGKLTTVQSKKRKSSE